MKNKPNHPVQQKRTENNYKKKHSKWQYIIITIALIFLGLNALPNLYQPKSYLLVSEVTHENNKSIDDRNDKRDDKFPNNSEQKNIGNEVPSKAELSPEYDMTSVIYQKLNSNGFKVNSIDSKGNTRRVELDSKADIGDAKKYLIKELGNVSGNETGHKVENKYVVEVISEDTTPAWLTRLGSEKIKLGLDLNGGVLIILKVDSETAFSERMTYVEQTINSLLRENKIRGVKAKLKVNPVEVMSSSVSLVYRDTDRTEVSTDKLIKEMRLRFPKITIERGATNNLNFYYSEIETNQFHQEVMLQALTTLRGRIEQLGITEAVTQRQGKNKVRIELPGVKDPKEAERIIGATASLDFYQLQGHGGKAVKSKSGETISVASHAIFSGKNIKNAQAGRDEMGAPLVNLTLDSEGGDKMLKFSSKNIGKPMATVFSEYYTNAKGEIKKTIEVINIATIQSQLGARFSITNMDSPQAASDLALLLRAGSLTAPITIVKKKAIDASLGQSNIENGVAALLLGIGLTLVFMSFWYKRLGFIANSALMLNLICLLGLMSLLPGAVLTLPGIAGLVLTVGMAVDTNVIIFERIKEETKQKVSHSAAVEHGYKNAFATIFDANVTTLITAFILYSIGYGPIKGFAITLGLGILTSLFTGVFISHVLTTLFYKQQTLKPTLKTRNIEGVKS